MFAYIYIFLSHLFIGFKASKKDNKESHQISNIDIVHIQDKKMI